MFLFGTNVISAPQTQASDDRIIKRKNALLLEKKRILEEQLKRVVEDLETQRKINSDKENFSQRVLKDAFCFDTCNTSLSLEELHYDPAHPNSLPVISMDLNASSSELINHLKRKKTEEEVEDQKEIQNALGLSKEQIDRVEMWKRSKDLRRNARVSTPLYGRSNQEASQVKLIFSPKTGLGRPFSNPELSNVLRNRLLARKIYQRVQNSETEAKKVYDGNHLSGKCSKCEETKESLGGNKALSSSSLAPELKLQLKDTIESLNLTKHKIQATIEDIKGTIPVKDLKAKLFMKKWGVKKIKKLMFRLEYNKLVMSFKKWYEVVQELKLEELKQEYSRAQGSMKFKQVHKKLVLKRLFFAFSRWRQFVAFQRNEAILNNQRRFATIIQCFWRRVVSRKCLITVRNRRKIQKVFNSATKLQSWYRGLMQRKLYIASRRMRRETKAAVQIQRRFRCFSNRRNFRDFLSHRKRERESSILIQTQLRRRNARKKLTLLRLQKVTEAALLVQCRVRQLKARKVASRQRLLKQKVRNATTIERVFRGHRDRVRCAKLRVIRKKQDQLKVKASLLIQRVYRGRIARRRYQLMLFAREEELRKNEKKIIFIQAVFRGIQGRSLAKAQKERISAENIVLAREWVEQFESRLQRYCFKNLLSGTIVF